jgi:nucleoside-diphosphate-sugar epimerase
MFKKLHAKIDEVLAILRLLPALLTDLKATMAVVSKDVTDGKATLAQVQALTGHVATVTALAAQAAVPTSAPIVLPPAPLTTTPTLHTELKADVAKVNPMAGVKLPGQ